MCIRVENGLWKKCSNSISIFLVAPDLSKGREKIDKPGQTKQNEILTSQVEKEVASLEMQGMWEVQGN